MNATSQSAKVLACRDLLRALGAGIGLLIRNRDYDDALAETNKVALYVDELIGLMRPGLSTTPDGRTELIDRQLADNVRLREQINALRHAAEQVVRRRCDTNSGAGVKRGWIEVRETHWDALQDARIKLGRTIQRAATDEGMAALAVEVAKEWLEEPEVQSVHVAPHVVAAFIAPQDSFWQGAMVNVLDDGRWLTWDRNEHKWRDDFKPVPVR